MSSSSSLKFGVTTDVSKFSKIYGLAAPEWGNGLNGEQFGAVMVAGYKDSRYHAAYYYEDVQLGKVIALAFVVSIPGSAKHVDRSPTSIPDPELIGVTDITGLLLTNVFVDSEYRNQGLAGKLLAAAIENTENEIIKHWVMRDDEEFSLMVVTDGKVDKTIANHLLLKKFVWYLNSAVGDYYGRFGFKGFPVDLFKVPFTLVTEEETAAIERGFTQGSKVGDKVVKLLRDDDAGDQALIRQILDSKQMTTIGDLSRTSYHPELGNERRRSLTSMSNLQQAARALNPALASMVAQPEPNVDTRVAFKPDYDFLDLMYKIEDGQANIQGTDEQKQFTKVKGAIITNTVTNKLYYVLWATQKFAVFTILSMGELQLLPFIGHTRRRSSLSTVVEAAPAYNLADLEFVFKVACVVGKKRGGDSLLVAAPDLPEDVPEAINFDFVENYLSSKIPDTSKGKVQFILGTEGKPPMVPMLKKFGSNDPKDVNFQWIYQSRLNWG